MCHRKLSAENSFETSLIASMRSDQCSSAGLNSSALMSPWATGIVEGFTGLTREYGSQKRVARFKAPLAEKMDNATFLKRVLTAEEEAERGAENAKDVVHNTQLTLDVTAPWTAATESSAVIRTLPQVQPSSL